MASEIEEQEDDSFYDIHRTSLLDVIEDKNRAANRKSLIHRMVIVSKLRDPDADRKQIGIKYEEKLKNLQGEGVTGLMLIYMKHVVHIVETSSEFLLETIKDLYNSEVNERGFVSSSKILNITHNISDRLFNQWNFRALEIQVHRLEAYEPSESTDRLVIDILSQLLKLGSYLSKQPKQSLKNALDSLHERVPDMLPFEAAVHYLLEEDDVCMYDLSEYLDLYQKPFDVQSDTDLVWPLPVRLFPYN
ncbi:hypothetical protein LOTGIDRAFT_203402 [Lottia gigantea]|uniref:BLUF domain-containing protein n=1 Tax=Lottia gigantea TaxID=225164 RepID=V4B9B4_LOTGI|nr:hypothetical protein LOTGIDRAFT_203402 [Lottia gigantea]ESP03946.1 hypothetical protein LOTGIDRAFT_203402 [Lottia gigantea]